jgi:predicted nucleic acid-binding protein
VTDFKKAFFDTALFIYYLENDGEYYAKAEKLFIDGRKGEYVTSTITVGEYLTGAFKKNDEQKASDFRNVITDYDFDVIPISWDVAEEAARIRAKYTGFKMMDSIQLAAAKLESCDLFVTNDHQLKQYDGIEVITIDDVEIRQETVEDKE